LIEHRASHRVGALANWIVAEIGVYRAVHGDDRRDGDQTAWLELIGSTQITAVQTE